TAVTHQFQGWLASLMLNKRRRRTIIVVFTMVFVLFAQVPNLINQWSFAGDPGAPTQELIDAQNKLYSTLTEGKITLPVYERQLEKLHEDFADKTEEIHRRKWEQAERL